ncbi:MAG: elongation factor P [Alphaproteobacteria bacterium]
MKINGNAVRPGMIIEHKGGLWRAMKSQETKPGKGGAFNQVELRNLRDGTKLNERFRAAENVERVRLDDKTYQFLFADGEHLTFMDGETFEQITVNASLIGEARQFLQDGVEVTLQSYEEEPLIAQLPEHVVLEVTDTEPVVKGQTAASSFKPATLDNGVRTMVPPHIGIGTRVVISTAEGAYVERAKD